MDKNKILIVDDVEINREMLVAVLEDKYECMQASGGKEAMKCVRENFTSISLILLDLMMPDMDGLSVLRALREEHLGNIPVIVITASNEREQKRQAFELGAVDYILKPFEIDVLYRVNTHVNLKLYQNHLEDMVEKTVSKMAESWATITQTMAEIIEYRNTDSGQHVKRTSVFAKMMLAEMNKQQKPGYLCSPQDARIIYEATSLHDVGKIGISDNILLKPGKLTDEEFDIMKTHTVIGHEMTDKIARDASDKYKQFCSEITLHHHEKWDGTGYPYRLAGEKIPLTARIVAIVDTYDAITNDRPYRKGSPHEVAVEEIKKYSGKQFDPYLVEIFLKAQDQIKEFCDKERDDELNG